MIKILLAMIAMFVITLLAWVLIVNRKTKNFQKYMKPGDRCYFYIGEVKHTAEIISVGEMYVNIVVEDGAHRVFKDEVYPKLTNHYN